MAVQVLLADDHKLIRDGLKPFLEDLDPDVTVLEAEDFEGAMEQATACDSLDLAGLDLKMPGMDGLKGIQRMVERFPDLPIVIISGFYGREKVLAALEAGAVGWIPKTMGGEAMVNALRLVLSGEKFLPSALFLQRSGEDREQLGELGEEFAFDSPLALLSAREKEIIGLLIEGNTNKKIARQLNLQEITVKIHLRNAYRKIGASNRADAVRISLQGGWKTVS